MCAKLVTSTFVAATLDRSICRKCNLMRCKCQCRRCTACQSTADTCTCPYPTRCWAYGRKQHDADLEGLEAMGQANSKLFAAGIITGLEFTKGNRHIEAMERKCHGKLFATRQRMQEKGDEYKAAENAAVPLTTIIPTTNSFGARVSTSEIQRAQKQEKKGW